jgi:hypothetical protein
MVITTVVLVAGLLTSISTSTGLNGSRAVDLSMIIYNSQ